jgi:hypothetical protein
VPARERPAELPGKLGTGVHHPLLAIWLHPRLTIRSIVDHAPSYGVIPLLLLSGFVSGFMDRAPPEMDLPEALGRYTGGGLFKAVLSLAVMYPLSGAIALAGRALGGKAPASQLRAAMAWGSLPMIPAYSMIAASLSAQAVLPPLWGLVLVVPLLVAMLLGCWAEVLIVGALAEVQGFSYPRVLAMQLIAALGICVVVGAIAVPIAIVFR